MTLLTFDELAAADFDQVYRQGKEEVLRDHAFRILLARADSVEKLIGLAFGRVRGLAGWTTKELIEIANSFRLFSAPELEIRLYRECQDARFRNAPRVREFYLLALNKAGRPVEAIQEAAQIIAEGGQNALVWGALGEAYAARVYFAEQLATALANPANPTGLDPTLRAQLPFYFPEITDNEPTLALVKALRLENLEAATRIFSHGFGETGSSYTGLGWLLRLIDHLADLAIEYNHLQREQIHYPLAVEAAVRLRLVEDRISGLYQQLRCLVELIAIALDIQGGDESLDYWVHAGRLLVNVIQGAPASTLQTLLTELLSTVDADFKLATTLTELRRICTQASAIQTLAFVPTQLKSSLEVWRMGADLAITHCAAGRAHFQAGTINDQYPATNLEDDPLARFRRQTINFLALTGNLLALHIAGNIGRVGARVPDLLINRQVQEDLADLVETKVLQALTAEDKADPLAVIARIQQIVGAGLKLGELQDLQSPAHHAFELRSDGLIALSGVDREMRKDTRTGTDLTAALLMQTGDCRETMYLNGALFACWQQRQVRAAIAKALLTLELDFHTGFQRVVHDELPRLLRYQLRGGQVAVYVEGIAMVSKYHCVRHSADDPIAVSRTYGIAELRAGVPLTHYELTHAILAVTYEDGSTCWIDSRDPTTGRLRPIEHYPVPGGGVPAIPDGVIATPQVRSIRLLNLVEEHALTLLYDTQTQKVERADGFYNEQLFASPYVFGSGPLNLAEIASPLGLIQAGHRWVQYPDGTQQQHPVYLRFLPFSQTDYEPTLVEGDIPGTIQLMGRTFQGDLKRERRRLEEGTSPIPTLLERLQSWEQRHRQATNAADSPVGRHLARSMLVLAREHPELVEVYETMAEQTLIAEGRENEQVYLVLSGQLLIYRHGVQLHDHTGNPLVVTVGGVVGEISALYGGVASATVKGDATVLSISKTVIQQTLATNSVFRRVVTEVANQRVF